MGRDDERPSCPVDTQMYSGRLSVEDIVANMQRFRSSEVPRENAVYSCMVQVRERGGKHEEVEGMEGEVWRGRGTGHEDTFQ